ncbi:hypothetical protein SAMN05216548_1264 [Faunimonas pinastri]|uniref:Uncharacterized protein n=1 Tax=Faunimonas pinastri TaxID=1855383 RepID=A0A1H9Q8F0_9HYPH|nr:hypothetical protein [Faunimonas pinastri]SER56678.1 hypothetical protein SAMN05216548_1264 [Faunimonas pinastri]
MDAIYPFDTTNGAEATSGDWVDEDVAQGIEGSVPPARVFSAPQTEILNAIKGVLGENTPSADDLTQLFQAIVQAHRITESKTYYVPGDYDTVQDCLLELSDKIIPSDVEVQIVLGAGDHTIDVSTGPVVLNHPYGSQISIRGQDLLNAFPTYATVDNATAATVEASLRAIFPTRIVVTGAVKAGFYMTGGGFGTIKDILFVGDKTAGQVGFLIGDWLNQIGTGYTRIEQCWFHNFGNTGLRINYASAVQAYRVGATHNTQCGFLAANMSGIQVLDTWIAMYNGYQGLAITDNSFAELFSGAGDFRSNTKDGIRADNTSNFQSGGATALRCKANGTYGITASQGGFALVYAYDGGTNTSGDLLAQIGATMDVSGSVTTPTCSPTANASGNQNSYIYSH